MRHAIIAAAIMRWLYMFMRHAIIDADTMIIDADAAPITMIIFTLFQATMPCRFSTLLFHAMPPPPP